MGRTHRLIFPVIGLYRKHLAKDLEADRVMKAVLL